ncbi:hypothetical protein CYMTET_26381 [Cymbomonas tetramitiformis]|uniref:Uncharacterized protein n=1 Tax=Cymbomonas tetramitiformis TaxID=36881 RepID=A0AAE0KXY7_9CHLO|nr:hypothetical protein CYMTET_26381 [Cymbomonas tetramitiformis]
MEGRSGLWNISPKKLSAAAVKVATDVSHVRQLQTGAQLAFLLTLWDAPALAAQDTGLLASSGSVDIIPVAVTFLLAGGLGWALGKGTQAAELEEENSELQAEVTRTKELMSSQAFLIKETEQRMSLRTKVSQELRDDLTATKIELEAAQSNAEKIAKAVASLESELEREQAISKESASKRDIVELALAEKEVSIAKFRSELLETQKERSSAEEENTRQAALIRTLEEEIEVLTTRIEDEKNQVRQEFTSRQEFLQSELDNAKGKVEELTCKIKSLTATLQVAEKSIAEANSVHSKAEQCQVELNAVKSQAELKVEQCQVDLDLARSSAELEMEAARSSAEVEMEAARNSLEVEMEAARNSLEVEMEAARNSLELEKEACRAELEVKGSAAEENSARAMREALEIFDPCSLTALKSYVNYKARGVKHSTPEEQKDDFDKAKAETDAMSKDGMEDEDFLAEYIRLAASLIKEGVGKTLTSRYFSKPLT